MPFRNSLAALAILSAPSFAQTQATPSLQCISGSRAVGLENTWSPLSQCPQGYTVIGMQRIDLQGSHDKPNLHINDFICDDNGCKAWCIGSTCTVEARCCEISLP